MIRFLLNLLLFAGLTIPATAPASQDPLADSLLQVLVTYQEHDPFLPWQKKMPSIRSGYGIVAGKNEVVTTENLVRNSTLVELRKADSGEKIQAAVVLSDEQANLAILRVRRIDENVSLKPVELAGSLSRTGDVSVLQFDETAQLQRGKAQVVQVSIKQLLTAPYSVLVHTILTDLNINGEGAAVVKDGKLVGLMISYDRSARTGSMLPCVILNHFLQDVRSNNYRGFASAGFLWSPLIDPAKRRYLNVDHDGKGILVIECLPQSGAAEVIRPNDVLIEWDGSSIDNLGFYQDPEYGRLIFSYLVAGRRSPGDTAPVKLIRNGKEMKVSVKLTRRLDFDSLVPDNPTRQREPYMVEGGFIIRELSGAYLNSYGADWQRNVDPRLVNMYLTQRYHPEKEGDRIVLLAGVLPDPINIGYQHFRDEVITAVNGERIRNINDVFRIADRDSSISRISLQSVSVDLVLDKDSLKEANGRLSELYRIPRLRFQASPARASK